MPVNSQQIVQKLWNYCHVLRDDGVSYGDYVEQAPLDRKLPRDAVETVILS